MADEFTASADANASVEDGKPEQEVLIPVAEAEETDGVDHNAAINDALDSAAEAMIASGMSEGDAAAFLNSARPRGVSTVTGNYADLQRMTGLPVVANPAESEDRLKFSHKIDKDAPVVEPTEAQAKELKASSAAALAAEKAAKK